MPSMVVCGGKDAIYGGMWWQRCHLRWYVVVRVPSKVA